MTSAERMLRDMVDYLPADEAIIGKHSIGSLDIVTTTERLICQRKFPPLFVEVHYTDIDKVEHMTRIRWNELAYSVSFIVLAAAVYYLDKVGKFASPLTTFITRYMPQLSNNPLVDLVMPAIAALTFAVGAYHTIRFIPSLNGYLRISRKDKTPVVIPSKMTPELWLLITEVEQLTKKKSEPVKPPQTAAPPQPANAEPEPAVGKDLKELNTQLNEVADSKVMIITSKSETHSEVVSNVLNVLVNQRDMGGVYLSITRPYEYILSTIKAAGIKSDDIYFIDCISLTAGKAHEQTNGNVVFVENPSSLEEVSMYLDKMMAKVKKPKKFLILDSLSSLLIYNTDKSVREFAHFIINKIRLENISGVILTIEKKEAEELVKTLIPMCDMEVCF